MRLYLDQMFRLDLAALLRSQSHDVLCAVEAGQQTADDREVLRLAINDGRVLVTMDAHFGDWAVLPLDEHPGVIRIKVRPATNMAIAELLIPFLASHDQRQLGNHFGHTVVAFRAVGAHAPVITSTSRAATAARQARQPRFTAFHHPEQPI